MVGIDAYSVQEVRLRLTVVALLRRDHTKLVVDRRVLWREGECLLEGLCSPGVQLQIAITHTELEESVERIGFLLRGLLKVFGGQLQVLGKLLLIRFSERLSILPVGAAQVVEHVVTRSVLALRQFELLDRFGVVLIGQLLESQAIGIVGYGRARCGRSGLDRLRGSGLDRLRGARADGCPRRLGACLGWRDGYPLHQWVPVALAELGAGAILKTTLGAA